MRRFRLQLIFVFLISACQSVGQTTLPADTADKLKNFSLAASASFNSPEAKDAITANPMLLYACKGGKKYSQMTLQELAAAGLVRLTIAEYLKLPDNKKPYEGWNLLKKHVGSGHPEILMLMGELALLTAPFQLPWGAELMRRSAERGCHAAQTYAAFLYGNGIGVNRNIITAYQWALLAAEAGYPVAKDLRESFRIKLTPNQRRRAEQWVSEWRKNHS